MTATELQPPPSPPPPPPSAPDGTIHLAIPADSSIATLRRENTSLYAQVLQYREAIDYLISLLERHGIDPSGKTP